MNTIKRGRKKSTFNAGNVKAICKKMEKYITETEIPILSEFAYLNHIARKEFYRVEGLNEIVDRLMAKKEAMLEKLALKNKINSTMAIFSLKQMGWKDRQDIDVSGKINITGKINWK